MQSRGFTLVELLIIIAIIGVLSSIVLVSLNTARMNGRIAAGKKFDQTVLSALGDQMVGEWRFEEGSGTTAYDTSGSANTGTLTNTPTWTTGLKGGALQFNGTNQYIQTNSAAIPSGGGREYTVSVWFIADDQTSGHRELVSQWTAPNSGNSFFLGTTQNTHIRFGDSWSDVDIGGWTVGEWHQLTVVSTTNNAYIYLDGALKATKGSAVSHATGPIVIGRQGTLASEYWKGKIDEVHIYLKTLTAEEVRARYAQERITHPVATNK